MNSFIEHLNGAGESFLQFVWPMFWQSCLLIALVFTLDFFFAKKIRASVRHALWLVVLVKLILPPTLALPTSAVWWLTQTRPAAPLPAPKHFSVSFNEAGPMAPLPVAAAVPELPAPKLNFAGGCLLASLTISLILLVWLAIRWWQIARVVREAKSAEEFSDALAATWLLAGAPNTDSVRLKIVESRMSPAICGLLRPVILLPRALAENLSGMQLRAVLLHEIIHLRRGDIWVNCAQALLQIFYWWHPLLWFANARIRRVREEAVDDAVMLALRDDAEAYAPTLLEVAKLALRRPLMSLGLVGIMESRSALRQRVERLLDFHPPRTAGLTIFSALGIVAFSAVALPMGEAPTPLENKLSTAPIISTTEPPAKNNEALPLTVSVTAQIYRGGATKFGELVMQNRIWLGGQTSESFVKFLRISPEAMNSTRQQFEAAGGEKLSAPRLGLIDGQAGNIFVGNETNSIRFDCMTIVTNGMVDLAVSGAIVAGMVTNLFQARNVVENYGGVLVQAGVLETDIILLSAQIITNRLSSTPKPFTNLALVPSATLSRDRFNGEAVRLEQLVAEAKANYEAGRFGEAKWKFMDVLGVAPDNATAKAYLELLKTNQQSSATSRTKEARQQIINKLNRIRLPLLQFNAVPLTEILRQLSQEARARDPEHLGVNFLINPNLERAGTNGIVVNSRGFLTKEPPATNRVTDIGVLPITIQPAITNAELSKVLDMLLKQSPQPIGYSIKDYGVVFSPRQEPEPSQFFIRAFKVDTNTFIKKLSLAESSVTTPTTLATRVSKAMRKAMTNIRVNLDSPPGKAVFYNDKSGKLLVRATESDLDRVERFIHDLNDFAQIHIKARFVKVPRGTASSFTTLLAQFAVTNNARTFARTRIFPATISASPVSNTVTMTGILTDNNFRTTLRALEARKGFENLGEPEVTTTSGRQCQIRSTEMLSVITNLLSQQISVTNQGSVTVSNSVVPQATQIETGPMLDVVPYVVSDGYTINLALIPSLTEFLGYDKSSKEQTPLPRFRVRQVATTLNLWDGQTAIISGLSEQNLLRPKSNSQPDEKELLVFVTATLVDPTGNRLHSDKELPFAQKGVPPQPERP